MTVHNSHTGIQVFAKILVLQISLVIPLNLLAIRITPKLEYLTINDGLSGNFVTHIHQDHYGYMWFGTMEGLNRYDGQTFTSFQLRPDDSLSLSDNFIRQFDEDGSGNLYVATNTAGLNFFNRRNEQFKRLALEGADGLLHESLSMVRFVNDTSIWIGTQDGFVLHYNPVTDTLDWSMSIQPDHPDERANYINDIIEDHQGNIWIASSLGGLDRCLYPLHQVEHALKADPLEERFRRNGCNYIIERHDNELWISRVGGLDRFNPENGHHLQYSFKDTKGEMLKSFRVIPYTDGRLVLNSYYDMLLFDPSTGDHQNLAGILPQYFTAGLYVDKAGTIWSGTMGYGVIKIDPNRSQFNTRAGNFWEDIYGREIKLMEEYFIFSPTSRDRDFLSIIKTANGDIWATNGYWGLVHLEASSLKVSRYTMGELDMRQRYQVMYEVYEDHRGDIWVSTVGGMSKLNRQTGLFEYHRLYPGTKTEKFAINKASYLDVSCIHEDADEIFWLGTPELGLIRFDPAIDSVKFIPVSVSQASQGKSYPILSILPDPNKPDHRLWLGTQGGGLVQFDKETQRCRFITEKEGLSDNTVNCVLPGGADDIWMSTNMGLSRYSISRRQFLNFDVRDGLQSNGYNRREAYISPEGELYFGGTYGFNHFFPEDIANNQTHSPLVLTGIDLLNEPIAFEFTESPLNAPLTLLDGLTLDHKQAMMVTFYYTALTFSSPHRDRFAYKLDGFDSRWIENGIKRSAVYTNLSPGKYTFRVRHLDDVYATSPQELSLGIVILPPFWATWWFKSLMVAIIITLFYLLIRRQFNRLQKKRIRQQLFSQQLLAYQEDERKRISGELHDGVGQNLLVIKNMLQLGLNNLQGKHDASANFQSASEIVSETIQEVREISHNLSPQHLEQLGLTSTLETVIENIERACEIEFTVDIQDIDNLLPQESEILVYRIVQESLNNIIKHSQADTAEVAIHKQAGLISIRISDNGVGYSHSGSATTRGIGISGMQERAQLLQGEISIKSGEKSGTVVHLNIELDR